MSLVLGASKGRGSAPNLMHTCREICVISLATFTIASADGLRHSELLAVLSAEAARAAGEEAQDRKRPRSRSCGGVAEQNRGRMDTSRSRREESGRARARAHAAAASLEHPLFGESSFLEQNRVTAATVQRYTRSRSTSFWPLRI